MPITRLREIAVPRPNPLMVKWFQWYSRRHLRKHFHGLRVCGEEHLQHLPARPVVLCVNHASWWDPIVAAVLAAHYLPSREHFAPIEEEALAKYAFFRRLGFFGVQRNSRPGSVQFLLVSQALLARRHTALWITVQGKFADVRERPFVAARGLSHLALRSEFLIVPVAIEYSFWEERTPEILVQIGEVLDTSRSPIPDWQSHIEQTMTGLLDNLSGYSIARRTDNFRNILNGETGTGGIYDLWRAAAARLRGERYIPAHGRRSLQ